MLGYVRRHEQDRRRGQSQHGGVNDCWVEEVTSVALSGTAMNLLFVVDDEVPAPEPRVCIYTSSSYRVDDLSGW